MKRTVPDILSTAVFDLGGINRDLELAIAMTPTSYTRNKLTDLNITVLMLIGSFNEAQKLVTP